MINVRLPDGGVKKFAGNLTLEKDVDTGVYIRILDGTTPVFDIPAGSKVTVAQAEESPHPRLDPK
ncbi:hypothetical protein [Rhodococcoides fascians]|uniref:hypothetical protein n=1 Tax=Rhodococcoides fascians TaxID=1828 RepID=UPI00117AB44E|nr:MULTISPECIES: hypothetical protein [Rhodococcus]